MTDQRARTRERLTDSALELFGRFGYEATTVAQIAAKAGVTEMTFFRHFATKADVLLADPYDPLIVAAVARQPVALDPLTRVIRGMRAAWRSVPPPAGEQVKERVRIAADSPSLRAAMWLNTAQTEAVIADQLIADGVDRFPAKIAAAAVLAAAMTALLEWSVSQTDDLSVLVESALDLLGGSGG